MAGFSRGGFDIRKIRNDEHRDEFSRVADDDCVCDVRRGFERVFDRSGRDKLSCGCFQQLLFAIGDDQVAVFVETADIAGAKPSVGGEDLASGFGLVVIALHDVRAFDQNFSVLCNFYLNVRNRAADGADFVCGRSIRGDDGRSLGESVALMNCHADGPEKFRELRRERRAASGESLGTAAEPFANF